MDVWHIADIAAKACPDDEMAQKLAVASQVAYTLGVAATLTKGDIPVIAVKPVEVEQPTLVAA